jgi:hypothetical protein
MFMCVVYLYGEHGFSQSIFFFHVYAVPLASFFMYQSATNALFEWSAVWCEGWCRRPSLIAASQLLHFRFLSFFEPLKCSYGCCRA